nr:hypothetical protein [Tanacetum cinerariifolium]
MLDSKAYKEYYAVASGAGPQKVKTKYKKKADESVTSPKSKTASASKGTRLKSKAKVTKPTLKKQPTKKTKAKGLAVLSEVALSEAKQVKLVTKRSKTDFHISQASGSGVPDVPPYKSKSDKESWGDSDDEDDDSDDDGDMTMMLRVMIMMMIVIMKEQSLTKSLMMKKTMDDEEDDEVLKELYKDVNVNLEKGSAEMTIANPKVFDAQKADEPIQSSFVSSDFTTKFLNLENPSLADNEIASLMETSAPHATVIPKLTYDFTKNTPPLPSFFNPVLQQQTPTIPTPTYTNPTLTQPKIPNFAYVFKFDQRVSALETEMSELKKTNQFAKSVSLIMAIVDQYLPSKMKEAVNNLYKAFFDSYNSNNDILSSYGEVVLLKRGRDDQEKDEDPSAGLNQGTKRRKSGKGAAYSKDSSKIKSSSLRTTLNNPLTRRLPKLTVARAEEPPNSFNEFNDTSFDFSAFVLHRLHIPNLTQEILVGPAFNLLKGIYKSITELEYHLEECSKATAERLDWHNPESKPYLENLKGGDSSKRFSTSITKTMAATYELKWIEDLVPESYASNLTSSKDVYSIRRIIAVTRIKIKKMYDYGHLEETEVRRDDQHLYTFKEGDFKRPRLQDIEDMLLLLIQHKLTNLTIDKRFDLNVAWHMFTRQQLGQEKGPSYGSGDKQATLSEEVDVESREVYWWKTLRARPMATKKDHMILSYDVLIITSQIS